MGRVVTRTSVTTLLLQLGFPGARAITNGGMFGYTPATIWMDNLYCYGTELRLEDCRSGIVIELSFI